MYLPTKRSEKNVPSLTLHMSNTKKKICFIFSLVTFLWAGLYIFSAQQVLHQQSTIFQHPLTAAGFFMILMLIAAAYWTVTVAGEISIKVAVLILVLLCIIPRWYLLHSVTIIQTSDYATYWENSRSIYENFAVAPITI